jgi:hypothetical protein
LFIPFGTVLAVAGVLTTLEGEMENQDDLIVLLNDYGRFGWETLPSAAGRVMSTTETFNTNAESRDRFDFQTEFDWETRHWQYLETRSDRRNDFVNFRDKVCVGVLLVPSTILVATRSRAILGEPC